ncbi:putative drug resistance protein [Rosellinia necatrix]|uniref:Putative drug resistance protein n=1 Tax=Rosellinia necatrix TaxID=77044 RepID=A0A1W2TXC4_ROSNE|nr:putative drug resistance protein [Rosellinia necatrix]
MKDVASRFRIANINALSPSIAGYDVAVGSFILVAGRLGDVFGHKRIFLIGLGWSAVWSLIAGASYYSTRPVFVVSRALQGVGAALTLPTSLELLRVISPAGTPKGVVFALYTAMPSVGLVVGVLGASTFARLVWWPWTYWAFSLILFVVGVIGCLSIPSGPHAASVHPGAWTTILTLDIPGMVTGAMCLGLFGFAWGQAQVAGWQHVYLWIILIMSLVLSGLFVMIEACYAPRPLIPYSALSSEVFWILVAMGCCWSSLGIWSFYAWQYVEHTQSASPLLVSYMMRNIAITSANSRPVRPRHTSLP